MGSTFQLDLPLPAVDPGTALLPHAVPLPRVGDVPAGGGPSAPTRLRLLVAEDDEVNQLVARAVLEREGADVTIVSDGAQAVDAALTTDFDALLMDCQMPVMDGLEATRWIRMVESGTLALGPQDGALHRRLPIVAMTASATLSDRAACLAVGMDDVLPKPWTPQQLTDVLDRLRAHARPSPYTASTAG